MNVLVIGSGGREHTIVWALKKSPSVDTVWCIPGNAGIELEARCVSMDLKDEKAVLGFLQEKNIGLTIIGPEAPLVDGLADVIRDSGRRVFGPGRAASRLEGSKVFAKNFMKTYEIPTADFKAFSYPEEALSFVKSLQWPNPYSVVKVSGLAAGKGVMLCRDATDVKRAVDDVMNNKRFGSAGDQMLLEEKLEGEELSVIALCDGTTLLPLVSTQDHKRLYNDDKGPNTGGMGAYGPVPQVTASLWREIEDKIFSRFIKGLREENLDFCGVIYFGLMLTADGPKVLEFNVRFGDPEAQVILPLVENDWLSLFEATVDRKLSDTSVQMKSGSALCVVMSSGGYPGDYEKGKEIQGLENFVGKPDVFVFHAGTSREKVNGSVLTSGGRVLGVTAVGPDLSSAQARAYEAVQMIKFKDAHYRTDIGHRALKA